VNFHTKRFGLITYFG
jgi:hypothetical protein